MKTSPDNHSPFKRGALRIASWLLCVLAAILVSPGIRANDEASSNKNAGNSANGHTDTVCSNAQVMAEVPANVGIGLAVGQKAPMFTLKNQNGNDVSLESLLKKGPVAVVFYRSADWCLFCRFELIHLQRNLKDFEAAGGQVVGVSYDSIAAIKKFTDSKSITLTLLSDPESKAIDAYNMRDRTADDPKAGYSAHATFVLDQKGIVRTRMVDVFYQEQPAMGILLKALKEAKSPSNAAQKKPAENGQPS